MSPKAIGASPCSAGAMRSFRIHRPSIRSSRVRPSQLKQFGYNNDYVAYFPLDGSSSHGILCVNHEYTNEELMFPVLKERQDTTGFKEMTEELVNIEMAAHGVTIVEIVRDGLEWHVVRDSPYNRRISPAHPDDRRRSCRGRSSGSRPKTIRRRGHSSARSTIAPAARRRGAPTSRPRRTFTAISGQTSVTPSASRPRTSAAIRP